MTERDVEIRAVWHRLNNLLQWFSSSGLNAYTGYFPDDFYGKLGQQYYRAIEDTKREIKICMDILK